MNANTATATATYAQPGYRLVVSLQPTGDDHEVIDQMIGLNSILIEHPGPDIVTLRIPYTSDGPHVAIAQLPRGVSFTPLLRDRLEAFLSPQALAVIELG
jgi:hypothetical protein